MPQPPITKIHLKITYLKFHSNFPGANELMLEQNWQSQGIPETTAMLLLLFVQTLIAFGQRCWKGQRIYCSRFEVTRLPMSTQWCVNNFCFVHVFFLMVVAGGIVCDQRVWVSKSSWVDSNRRGLWEYTSLGVYLLYGKTSYWQISRSSQPEDWVLKWSHSLRQCCQISKLRKNRQVYTNIFRLRDFTRFYDKTSYHLINSGQLSHLFWKHAICPPAASHTQQHYTQTILAPSQCLIETRTKLVVFLWYRYHRQRKQNS